MPRTIAPKPRSRWCSSLLVSDQPERKTEAHDPVSKFWGWADKMGIETGRFPERAKNPDSDRSHPAMAVNLDACIHCNLCVRACREVQVNDVIGMAGRGHQRKDRVRFRRSDGPVDLRRLRRMRAGLPDRRADAGVAASTRTMCAPNMPTSRSIRSAPIAASAASSPTTSRTTSSFTSPARTARRTRIGCA